MTDTAIAHRRAWELIPWVVNGTASATEREAVEAHLEGCADCRGELEFQRGLQATIAAQSRVEGDVRESWQRLRHRIDAAAPAAPAQRLDSRRGRAGRLQMRWLVAAMVVQAIGLAGLGAALWSRPYALGGLAAAAPGVPAAYRTLSSTEAAAPAATIRVVFAPEVTVAQVQSMLAAAHLQVVAGPSNVGVWTLGPARDSSRDATETALRELRARTEVRFAEAVAGAP